MNWLERLAHRLSEREAAGELRHLVSPQITGDFASNDYLSIARNRKTTFAADGGGSTGSRLLGGDNDAVRNLETRFAEFFRGDAALFFPSGYHLNLGLTGALIEAGDIVLADQQVHASLSAGIKLCGAKSYRFRHNDLKHLSSRLERLRDSHDGAIWLVTESLFSMSGELAPLGELHQLAEKFDCQLLVDEAHAAGVLGPGGAGLLVEQGLTGERVVRGYALGKGFGAQGAVWVGPSIVRSSLINFAHSFIYTTAPAYPQIALAAHALDDVIRADKSRAVLQDNIAWLRRNLNLPASRSPIIPWPCGKEVAATAERLQSCGLWGQPVRSPTVKRGYEQLRLSVHAHNTRDELAELVRVLKPNGKTVPAQPMTAKPADESVFVTGIGTGIGKTVVSSILVQGWQVPYWKPIQCGDLDSSDTMTVQGLTERGAIVDPPERYQLRAPLSPNEAALLEDRTLKVSDFERPISGPMVVEGAGGMLVPINDHEFLIDIARHLQCRVVLVIQHYLGCINHSLLSIEALHNRGIPILGIVFNGKPHPEREELLLRKAAAPCLLHIAEHERISPMIVEKYAAELKPWQDIYQGK